MTDREGVEFLQWCLPRLGLRWRGFRRVRRIVVARVQARIEELALPGAGAYRSYLDAHPDEWRVLDSLCWIPVSRFYRDRAVFEFLERVVLPELAALILRRRETALHCWSVGCAAGQEPYTLAIVWQLRVQPRFPGLELSITATDSEPEMLRQAAEACYPAYVLADLPADLRDRAFVAREGNFVLKREFRARVALRREDVRRTMPHGPFALILCRNLVLTYFDEPGQRETLAKLVDRLIPGGALVFGATERPPGDVTALEPWSERLRIYRRTVLHATGSQ